MEGRFAPFHRALGGFLPWGSAWPRRTARHEGGLTARRGRGRRYGFARQKVCFRAVKPYVSRAKRYAFAACPCAPRASARAGTALRQGHSLPRHAPRPARAGEPRGGMEGLGSACGKRALKAQMGLCGQNRAKLRSNLSIWTMKWAFFLIRSKKNTFFATKNYRAFTSRFRVTLQIYSPLLKTLRYEKKLC